MRGQYTRVRNQRLRLRPRKQDEYTTHRTLHSDSPEDEEEPEDYMKDTAESLEHKELIDSFVKEDLSKGSA